MRWIPCISLLGVVAGGALGCSSSTNAIVYGNADAGTSQTPPTNGPDVEAWLKRGDYKAWHSEPAVHASRAPSPHGFNRIYANAAANAAATSSGSWPAGVAYVKELYTSASAASPTGYSVSFKTQANSNSGTSWYWYERFTDNSILFDGMGTSSSPCVQCHTAAGSDSAHTPSAGSHDFVYTPVP